MAKMKRHKKKKYSLSLVKSRQSFAGERAIGTGDYIKSTPAVDSRFSEDRQFALVASPVCCTCIVAPKKKRLYMPPKWILQIIYF